MVSYSPYSISVIEPLKWRPGEEVAAGAFVGMTIYLVVEVNAMIFCAFKKKKGLYFWSLQLGTLGILMETIGTILKYFGSSSTNGIWPLYMLFILIGWSVYTTAQSLVLYSRLHLVMRNQRIQRYVLYMIVSTIFTFVLPHWIFEWPAYNTSDHEMSSLWSPRAAIVQRYSQIGYTITESIISGLYIWSLVPLLRLKSDLRQRRVMTDLLCVNVMVIALDIVQVSFAYTNQVGISEPLQSFSYALKLRLEFLVLNQLMEFAARGMRNGNFGYNRYYRTARKVDGPAHDSAPSQEAKNSHLTIKKDLFKDPAQTALASSMPLSDSISFPSSTYQTRPTNRSGSDDHSYGLESQTESDSFDHTGIADRGCSSSDGNPLTQKEKIGVGFFDKRPQAVKGVNQQSSRPPKDSKLLAFRRGDRLHRGNSEDNRNEEGEIELHMWGRRETAGVDLPWFLSKVEV